MSKIDLDDIMAMAPEEEVRAALYFIEQRLGGEIPPGSPMSGVVAYGCVIANLALNAATVTHGGGVERRDNALRIVEIIAAVAADAITLYPTEQPRPIELAQQRTLN